MNANSFPSASLYVGDLHPDVSEAMLFELFNSVGPVSSIRVCRDTMTRRSLGYAYVNYHHAVDAERALDSMNFTNIKGVPCRIMWCHRDPSIRKSGVGNIFIKNLEKSIDNKTLYDTFSTFGNILSCKVVTDSAGNSRGYGFVHYETQEAADQAIAKVNGMEIADRQVKVLPFIPKKDRLAADGEPTFTNVFVKNLPEDMDEEGLKKLLSPAGKITSAVVMKNDEGASRGFGFCNFESNEEAKKAVEDFNGHEFEEGKPALYVARAQKKSEREAELRNKWEKIKMERQEKYSGVNLYVKNLDQALTEDDVRKEFETFGTITSCKIMRDDKDVSRGFGFVCFSTQDEATKAVNDMNGKMLANKPLYVALAQRKDVRRAQLEAQHAQRQASQMRGMPPSMGPNPGMYPPGGAPPMFYGNPLQQRQFMYGNPMMPGPRGPWRPGPAGAPTGPAPPGQFGPGARGPMPYMNMPPQMAGQRGPVAGGPAPQGGRGGKGRNGAPAANGGKGAQQGGGRGFKYTATARNQNATGVMGAPPVGMNPMMMPPGGMQPMALDASALAAAPPDQQKKMLGEQLFPRVMAVQPQPQLAGKLTGMLLDMEVSELLHLIESQEALHQKIGEALAVLQQHSGPAEGEAAKGEAKAESTEAKDEDAPAAPAKAVSGDAAEPAAEAGEVDGKKP